MPAATQLPMPDLPSSTYDRSRLLLTLPQAAHDLSISRRTLERLISAGIFPAPVKIGRSSRIPREDLAAYLEKLCLERGGKPGRS
jgi:excisionase family DNA binding protein